MQPILYIVIPCYNEEQVLPITCSMFLEKIKSLVQKEKISDESRILFVNDGSKDKTWEIIKQLAKEDYHYKGISQSRNRGHQNAVLAGLMEAKDVCDITISIDCDGQDDINAMDAMVDAYLDGCEIVYGVRSRRDTDTFFKRFTAGVFSGIGFGGYEFFAWEYRGRRDCRGAYGAGTLDSRGEFCADFRVYRRSLQYHPVFRTVYRRGSCGNRGFFTGACQSAVGGNSYGHCAAVRKSFYHAADYVGKIGLKSDCNYVCAFGVWEGVRILGLGFSGAVSRDAKGGREISHFQSNLYPSLKMKINTILPNNIKSGRSVINTELKRGEDEI